MAAAEIQTRPQRLSTASQSSVLFWFASHKLPNFPTFIRVRATVVSHLSRARGVDRFFISPLESYMPLALVGCRKKLKIPTPSLRFVQSRFCQQPSIMRCATTLIASLSMAAAMRLPAMAVPSSSLAPRMYDLRGGGKAAASSPFDMLKGRKIVLPSA